MSASIHPIPTQNLPPMNVAAYVRSILKAANKLLAADLPVVAFQADVTATPVIWLNATPRVRRLVDDGMASYDRTGTDECGNYRVGAFVCEGIRVQWLERVLS